MARNVIEFDLRKLGFKRLTVGMLRNVVFQNMIVSGPGLIEKYMPSSDELQTLNEMARFAVDHGQVIDFGYWPNDLIKSNAKRGAALYTEGALPMPFTTPWIFLHTWDDSKLEETAKEIGLDKPDLQYAAYLIYPLSNEDGRHCVDFEACILEGYTIAGQEVIGVGDRLIFDGKTSGENKECYVQCIPMQWRFGDKLDSLPGINKVYGWEDAERAAVGNICDPLINALMILNTRGINQQTITASPKLNKARLKNNKPPIPPYRKVDSATYVTALMKQLHGSREPRLAPGVARASPVTHVRIGHWRNYKSGQRTFIYDTLVKATPEAKESFRATRSHYTIGQRKSD